MHPDLEFKEKIIHPLHRTAPPRVNLPRSQPNSPRLSAVIYDLNTRIIALKIVNSLESVSTI